MTDEELAHKIMVLRNEVGCQNARTRVLNEKIDHLEEGLQEIREQLARIREFRRKAGNRSLTE